MSSARPSDSPRTGLILGVERCGSTWLSNLLDSAPEVETYMEPLARVAGVVEDLPDRLAFIDAGDLDRWRPLGERFENLPKLKYHGAEWPGAPGWLRALNWRVHEWLSGPLSALLPDDLSAAIQAYSELNFNRRDNPSVQRFVSRPDVALRLYKFLRLNTKVRLIESWFPEATVTVLLRNPLAQSRSIVARMERGSLIELDDVFRTLSEDLERHPRLRSFGRALQKAPEQTPFARALAFWFVSYSVLTEDLASSDLDVQWVRYETLCEQPEETTHRVFDHHDLDIGPQTRHYIDSSTSGNSEATSATDTSRDSAAYYRRQLRELDPETIERFWRVADPFWNLAPEPVRHYEKWLDRFIGPRA